MLFKFECSVLNSIILWQPNGRIPVENRANSVTVARCFAAVAKNREGRDQASVSQFPWLKCVGFMRLVFHIPRYCILFVCVGCAIGACYGQTPNAGALK